jgi:hypothetical protein
MWSNIFYFFLVGTLLLSFVKQNSSELIRKCETMDETNNLRLACAGVVSYSFYVPSGESLDTLNREALKQLNNSNLSILPTSCQSSVRKVVCGNIYLKCVDDVDLANKSTWQKDIFADVGEEVSLPFNRPCKRSCVQMHSMCFGILSLIGVDLSCDEKYDYGIGLVDVPYSQVTNQSACL